MLLIKNVINTYIIVVYLLWLRSQVKKKFLQPIEFHYIFHTNKNI